MRTVLCRTTGRVAVTLALTGVVGGLAAVPALAGAGNGHPASHRPAGGATSVRVRLAPAVAYVRMPDGSVHRFR